MEPRKREPKRGYGLEKLEQPQAPPAKRRRVREALRRAVVRRTSTMR